MSLSSFPFLLLRILVAYIYLLPVCSFANFCIAFLQKRRLQMVLAMLTGLVSWECHYLICEVPDPVNPTIFNQRPLALRLFHGPALPWLALLLIIGGIICTSSVRLIHWQKTHINISSIKECIDNHPAGICCYRENGHIVLSNSRMNQLSFALMNRPLLNGKDLEEATSAGILTLPDNHVWKFQRCFYPFRGAMLYELTATDITELYQKTRKLQEDTKKAQAMKENLATYNRNIDAMIRSQEILHTKVSIHDEMNRILLALTASIETPCSQEEQQKLLTLTRTTFWLLGQEGNERQQNSIQELENLANLIGVRIIWRSPIPRMTEQIQELFHIAAREAIANAVKHADAEELTIDCQTEGDFITFRFTNQLSGKQEENKPVQEAIARGGLKSLQVLSKGAGGYLETEKEENFSLILHLPTHTEDVLSQPGMVN